MPKGIPFPFEYGNPCLVGTSLWSFIPAQFAANEDSAERMPRYAKKPSVPPVHFMVGLREALRRTKEADPENADGLSLMPQLFEKLCRQKV